VYFALGMEIFETKQELATDDGNVAFTESAGF